jgi:hypothetical protein
MQAQVLGALTFKTDVLWSQLDALYFAYVEPGLPPPGAWVPGAERDDLQPEGKRWPLPGGPL